MIFIACPAKTATGGTELCHQLARCLLDKGLPTQMLYMGKNKSPLVAPRFEKYAAPYITDIRAVKPGDVVVMPETLTGMLFELSHARRFVWWMSVDNYFYSLRHRKWRKRIIQQTKRLFGLENKFGFNDENIGHLCQSHYAANFLKQRGVSNTMFLSDYLSEDFLAKSTPTARANTIAYNPSKGFEFTQKIIAANPDLNFVPIKNMTPAQVKDLLCKSKIYIDFGNHPGKDRPPREAAVCGCCIITSRDGSACFTEDVPILEKYKFFRTEDSLEEISKAIRDTLLNYESCILDFKNYAELIRNEPQLFMQQVENFVAAVTKFNPDGNNLA